MSQLLSVYSGVMKIDVNSNANERIKGKQAKREQALLSHLHIDFQRKESMAQIRGRSSHPERSGLKVNLPTLKIWIRNRTSYFKLSKSPSQLCPSSGGLGVV